MNDMELVVVVLVAFGIGYALVSFVIGRFQKRRGEEDKMMPPKPPDDPWK